MMHDPMVWVLERAAVRDRVAKRVIRVLAEEEVEFSELDPIFELVRSSAIIGSKERVTKGRKRKPTTITLRLPDGKVIARYLIDPGRNKREEDG